MKRFIVVPAVLVLLVVAGCAKRPATSQVSAPAPGGAGGAADATTGGAVGQAKSGAESGVRGAAVAARPSPKAFAASPDLKDIYFDFDKYEIRPPDASTLDANAKWLKANENQLVLIEGHADERGTNEYNVALGERRAKAAMNYLVSHGVRANRITVVSYGEERPVCMEHGEACWAKNRRAHFLVKAE